MTTVRTPSCDTHVDVPRRRRPDPTAADLSRPDGPPAPDTSGPPTTRRQKRLRLGWYLLVGDLLGLAVPLVVRHDNVTDLMAVVSVPAVYRYLRLYRSRLVLSFLDDLPSLLLGGMAAMGVGSAVPAMLAGEPLTLAPALGLTSVLLLRWVSYALVRRARRHGLATHRTCLVGAGLVGTRLARALKEHPEYGLTPVGFLDDGPPPASSRTDLPVVGRPRDLAMAIKDLDVRVVIVAYGLAGEADLVGLLRTCDRLDCEIFLVPRLFELGAGDRDHELVWGIPLVRRHRSAAHAGGRWAKRAFDVAVAAVALLLLMPLLLLVALAVRVDGGPGVLFTQERVGRDGDPFTLLKFRSLLPRDDDESAVRWSVSGDVRVTRLGRLLRQTSVDELPQLWNVLRGDMSLVGPRPERPHFVKEFAAEFPHYMARQRVPAGLTGWAQVNGLRGDTSISDRALFDNAYIEDWSVWADCKVLARTVGQVVRRGGG